MRLEDSYDNWVQKLDLTCMSSTQIGNIATMYFAGWLSTLVFVPRLADMYGRYKLIILANIISVTALFSIVLTHSYGVMLASLWTLGMTTTVVKQISMLYNYENAARSHYSTTVAVLFVIEGTVTLLCTFYYTYISKHWIALGIIALTMGIISIILSLRFVESPRFLAKAGKKEELCVVLELIAKRNDKDQALVSTERV